MYLEDLFFFSQVKSNHGEELVAANEQIKDDKKQTKMTGLLKYCGVETVGNV